MWLDGGELSWFWASTMPTGTLGNLVLKSASRGKSNFNFELAAEPSLSLHSPNSLESFSPLPLA